MREAQSESKFEKPDRLTYTVEELGQILGLGRGATYAALRKAVIPSIRIGRRFVIPKPAVDEWLRSGGGQ
jgi:excisionase family DNA binding protein